MHRRIDLIVSTRPEPRALLTPLVFTLGLAACAAPASATTVVVTPGSSSPTASAMGSFGAPPGDKTMLVHVGDTTIRYTTGSSEATAALMKSLRHARAGAAACYDAGVARDRSLRGRVIVQLRLDPSGAIRSVDDGGSALPDREVVDCILRAFRMTSFAEIDGSCTGDVAVTEPLDFEPRMR